MSQIVVLILIGLLAGVASGLFGIGGGVIIVPALVFILKFSMHRAIGTSLAVLLPPVGLGAVWDYYHAGHVDIRAALVIAATMLVGAWLGAYAAEDLSGQSIKVAFGVFLIVLGVYSIWFTLQAEG